MSWQDWRCSRGGCGNRSGEPDNVNCSCRKALRPGTRYESRGNFISRWDRHAVEWLRTKGGAGGNADDRWRSAERQKSDGAIRVLIVSHDSGDSRSEGAGRSAAEPDGEPHLHWRRLEEYT